MLKSPGLRIGANVDLHNQAMFFTATSSALATLLLKRGLM